MSLFTHDLQVKVYSYDSDVHNNPGGQHQANEDGWVEALADDDLWQHHGEVGKIVPQVRAELRSPSTSEAGAKQGVLVQIMAMLSLTSVTPSLRRRWCADSPPSCFTLLTNYLPNVEITSGP